MARKVALGLDIGGTNIKAGIVDLQGNILCNQTIPTEFTAGTGPLLKKIENIITDLRMKAMQLESEVCGVGIGMTGQINAKRGTVDGTAGNLPGWDGFPLGDRIIESTGLKVVIDNDVNVVAIGEAWKGAGRQWNDFVCVTLGTGVGGCFILNKQPYRGNDGYAGEFGHQIIQFDGYPCGCGNQGCWEQYASVTALNRMIHNLTNDSSSQEVTPFILFEKAKGGYSEEALTIVNSYAKFIAIGLVGIIHAFNPPGIVIGGAITAQGDFLFEKVRSCVNTMILPVYKNKPPIQIVPAQLGEAAGIIGSAGMLFQETKVLGFLQSSG